MQQFDFYDICGILIMLFGIGVVALLVWVASNFLFGKPPLESTVPKAMQGVLR